MAIRENITPNSIRNDNNIFQSSTRSKSNREEVKKKKNEVDENENTSYMRLHETTKSIKWFDSHKIK